MSATDASATLQRQFVALQEQQARKLARRKQRAEERTKSTSSLTGRQGPDLPSSGRSELSTAASRAFGIDDDLGLGLAPPSAKLTPAEEQQNLRDQIRELRDETGRLYKLLSERDLEVRHLRKRNDQQKAILETSGSGTNETAALKIVELSKKVRELTAELESERTKSKQWARKCLDLEEKKDTSLPSTGGKGSARSHLNESTGDKVNLESELKALQHRFNQSELKASEMRNECQHLRQELKVAQKVLANEVGEGVTVQSLINAQSGWRGRAQQVLALQKKVTELKSQQHQSTASTTESLMGDDLEREFMGSGTFRKATANDNHREQLRRAERERKEAQERLMNELRALEADQETTKSKLDASKARNKVLCGEVKSLKAQIATLLDKGKHDDELLQALMKQQTQLKNLVENSSQQDTSGKAEVEARLREIQRKAQQDINMIKQLQAIVTEKEAKIIFLDEELKQLRLNNLQQAQMNGVNACFERAASRATSSASTRPATAMLQDDGTMMSSPTPPPSASSNALRQSLVVMEDGTVVAPSGVTPSGIPLAGPIPKSTSSHRVPSAHSERPASRKLSARDHPTNSSGDPGVPQISAAELQELQAQVQQFRSLSQAAEVERDKLAELVKVLQQRIGVATEQVAEAQKDVQAQKRRSVILEKQLGKVKVEQQTGRTSGKRSSKMRGSTTTLHELIEDEVDHTATIEELQTRLEIQEDENAALKAALQSTLRAKEDDLQLYQEIMEQTKAVFLQGLRQHRQQAQSLSNT